jgi:hypothetical protein
VLLALAVAGEAAVAVRQHHRHRRQSLLVDLSLPAILPLMGMLQLMIIPVGLKVLFFRARVLIPMAHIK